MSVAYNLQTKQLNNLIDTNISLFNSIKSANDKSELWRSQIKKQEVEIAKLNKRKKNRLIWFGAGVLVGAISVIQIAK